MIVIAILALPFVFYFNKTDLGAARVNDLGRIYDRPVTLVEYSRNAHLMNLANFLGLNLGNDLMTTNVKSENEMYAEFTWNRLVMRHEAEQLGILPNASEILALVKTLSRFQTETHFDMNKYTEFTQTMLPSLGFSEAQIEELVSDQLSLNRMKDLLGTGAQISDSDSKENYEKAYGNLHVAVVRLQDEDFKKDIKIGDDEVSKYYDVNKEKLKSEEKRRVEFVNFTLTDPEKKLTGKERVDALQKVANRANDFTQALLEKDAKFTEVASKFESPVAATEEFTSAAPASQFKSNPQLTQYSFQLTQKEPNSDAIQGPDGFYVLHLLGVTEAHPLNLEEAKPKIVETLSAERLRQLVSNRATEIAQQMRDATKAGTSLDTAIGRSRMKLSPWWPPELASKFGLTRAMEPNGQKLERLPLFALADNSSLKAETELEPKYETPDLQTIKSAVVALEPGGVSDFIPVTDGGIVAVLEKRDPADPAGFEEAKAKFETGSLTQRRRVIFVEWMRDRRRAARVTAATG
jgi:hypothetical protein